MAFFYLFFALILAIMLSWNVYRFYLDLFGFYNDSLFTKKLLKSNNDLQESQTHHDDSDVEQF